MAGNPPPRETAERRPAVPESLSPFVQMVTSFSYSSVGTASNVGGERDDAVACRTKKQMKTRGKATPRGKRKSPAAPQTPPPLSRRRVERPSAQQVDGAASGCAVTSRTTMLMDSDDAGSYVEVGDVRRQGEVPSAGPCTPFVLPRHKNCGSSKYFRRKGVRGNPPSSSRFFVPDEPSALSGEEEQLGEAVVISGDGARDITSHDDENKVSNLSGASRQRKKTRKRSCKDAIGSQPRIRKKGEKAKLKNSKKKKVVVVSPYFAVACSDQRVSEVEVVVQRRAKKRPTGGAELAGEPQASGGGNGDSFGVVDDKRKRKRKRRQQLVPLSAAERMADAYKRVPDDNQWVPPFSNHGLLQEFHFFDHWRVLVICMLLNRTTGREVQKVLPRLFLLCPNAEAATKVSDKDIEKIIKHLGLQRKRSKMIKRMSEEYLQPEWTHVTQLHGIGKYAADAYAIFCSGMWKDVRPNDHKLVDYWRFLLNDKDVRESMMVP